MAAAFVHNEHGLKKTGSAASIPNHPKARLMYYLQSVSTVLQINQRDMARLSNYSNYQGISEEETDALLRLVILFSPDELIGKVFFPSDQLCGDFNNQFYELSRVSHVLAVSNSVLVGGKQTRVAKIMTFKSSWLQHNYLTPIGQYRYRLSRLARGLPGYEPPTYNVTSSASCAIL